MTLVPLPIVSSNNKDSDLILSQSSGGVVVRRSVLPGGVRVLSEFIPGQRSTTIGFWVGVGSRDEAVGYYGSTHFLEHLLFKGTKRRSSLDISASFDDIGGETNAATSKESTCYYARILDEHLPMAVDVIADMVTSARVDFVDFENERGVILEELAMNEDDPSDFAHESFVQKVLGEHPLGRPIGGTASVIESISHKSVLDHYSKYYQPQELVITAAGSLDHGQLCDLVFAALGKGGWDLDQGQLPVGRRSLEVANIVSTGGVEVISRSVEQVNMILGSTGISVNDPRRFALNVLNTVLGGGMSSRLFQEIREKRGLAYSTYSFSSSYSDGGYFGLYAGCLPNKTRDVLQLMTYELERMAQVSITAKQLKSAIGQLCGSLVLGLEDNSSRMSWLAKAELVLGRYYDVEEILFRIKQVTVEQVQELAADLFARRRCLTIVGALPGSGEDFADFVR